MIRRAADTRLRSTSRSVAYRIDDIGAVISGHDTFGDSVSQRLERSELNRGENGAMSGTVFAGAVFRFSRLLEAPQIRVKPAPIKLWKLNPVGFKADERLCKLELVSQVEALSPVRSRSPNAYPHGMLALLGGSGSLGREPVPVNIAMHDGPAQPTAGAPHSHHHPSMPGDR